ncbi:MAG: hypothetical protein KDC95_05640 [Planctomycetes bacterium]|nr:hypothetical protein [Planctomycetota bacterium]
MERWSEDLFKERVAKELFDETSDMSREDLQSVRELAFLCEGVFRTVERVQTVRSKIERLRKSVSKTVQDVADEALEELTEIESDLELANSRRGRFLRFANDYVQELYVTLRADAALAGVSMGSHPQLEQLMVVGSVADAAALSKVADLLGRFPPGVPVMFQVLVDCTPSA